METFAIPAAPVAFHHFQATFLDHCAQSATTWHIPDQTITDLLDLQRRWAPAYSVAADPATSCPAATAERNAALTVYKAAIVDVMNHFLVNSPLVSPADKQILGIHPITAHRARRNGAPESFPVLQIGNKDFDQHRILYQDADTVRKGKPEGVAYCEIRYQVGEAPEGPEAAAGHLNMTRSGEVIRFAETDRNRYVHYFARWVSPKGQYGPWAPVVSQVIR